MWQLGLYEILGPLGAGGMGEVYHARDPRLGREVAVKILPEAFSRDPARLARFDREARTLAALNHPRVPGSPMPARRAIAYGTQTLAGSRTALTSYIRRGSGPRRMRATRGHTSTGSRQTAAGKRSG